MIIVIKRLCLLFYPHSIRAFLIPDGVDHMKLQVFHWTFFEISTIAVRGPFGEWALRNTPMMPIKDVGAAPRADREYVGGDFTSRLRQSRREDNTIEFTRYKFHYIPFHDLGEIICVVNAEDFGNMCHLLFQGDHIIFTVFTQDLMVFTTHTDIEFDEELSGGVTDVTMTVFDFFVDFE